MKYFSLILLTILVLSGCSDSSANISYEDNKKMVVDALQTEDGKKALRTIFADSQFRDMLVIENEQVKKSVEETMLSKEAEEFWKEVYQDPKFSEAMAKSMLKQQEDLMKSMMKDSEYLKDLETFFSSPEMKKELEKSLKASDMRKEIEKVVEETIKSPALQAKWQKLVEEAGGKSSEDEKSKDEKSKDEESKGEESKK